MFIISLIFLARNFFGFLPQPELDTLQEIQDSKSLPSPFENLFEETSDPLLAKWLTQKSRSFRRDLCRSFSIINGKLPASQSFEKSPLELEPVGLETSKNSDKASFSDKEKEDGSLQEQIETEDSSVKLLSEGIEEVSLYNGLPNFGNTCFANSLVQSLFHIESFREGILQAYHDRSHGNNLLDLLAELFIEMKTGSNKKGTLYRKFLKKMFYIRNEFKIGIQGDSSALFRALVEELCEERDINGIPYLKIFTGEDLNIIKECPKCGAERDVNENMRPLEVMDIHFLKDKSRTFFKKPTELRRCTQCNARGELKCRYNLTEAPEILAIRIQDTRGSMDTVKILESFVIFEGVKKKKKRVEYRFVAGVLNTAKGERGHHSVEVSQIDGKWYQISDESCWEISNGRVNYHPKILFYQRH